MSAMTYLYNFKLDPSLLECIDDCITADRVTDVDKSLAKINYRIVHLVRALDQNLPYRMKCENPKTVEGIIQVFMDHFMHKRWMNGPKPVVVQFGVFNAREYY